MNSIIQDLAARLSEPHRARQLEDWRDRRLSSLPGAEPPVYASIDVRNAGFKVSVVDTNLFPAGFNNLCETFSANAAEAFKSFFKAWHPSVRKILIFPEAHTRNLYYWKNVEALRSILVQSGMETEVHPREGFVPDLILLNNDLSSGIPEPLRGSGRLLLPSPDLGWHRRRKSDHFRHFEGLAIEAAEILEVDPWLITPLSESETGVDLSDEICLKRLKDTADRLLDRIRDKYRRHGIARAPYLFIKNDAGTYGMGVTHVDSGSAFLKLSRRIRNKLESSKGGASVREYLLQEGIPTADLYRGKPIEPVVYLVGGENVGMFFRIHEEKNELENLNAPGMTFDCLCLHKLKNRDDLFKVASVLGRIASLASVLELHATAPASARSA
jgi:glutamate--cysteine ligase